MKILGKYGTVAEVESGDTLTSIARALSTSRGYGVYVNDLLRWNPQIEDGNLIYADEVIWIVPMCERRGPR